jgi:flagellar basal body P-ring protein FlgI
MKPRWIMFGLGLGLVTCTAGLVGCFGPRAARMQSPEEGEKAEVRTVGDITDPALQEEIPVYGVGLVTHLNATGGGAPPAGQARDDLERDLKKKGVRNVKTTLENTNCTMVIVHGAIPASCRKNDTIDLEISLPDQSRCTSLKGGYLIACELFNYEDAKNINPGKASGALKGYPLVKAEGPVVSGMTGKVRVVETAAKDDSYQNEDESERGGHVWGGGKVQIDPPIMLLLRQNFQYSRVADQIANRINATFPGMKYGHDGVASAKNKSVVMIGVPLQYRYDVPHYLRVVRAVPLDRSPPPDSPYRKQLAEQLLDPSKCLQAAIRLEALGEDSVPLLKPALAAPMPLSRFAAAQALTYLRKRDGVEELTRLAKQHPALRGLALTTLASLDESICHTKLADLMADPDPELRYGAFCGLRRLDERSPELAAEKCKDAYVVHQVAPESEPMVHYLTGRRTEFVLFGRTPTLLPGLRIAADEFTLTTTDDGQAVVKRFRLKDKDLQEKRCPAQVAEVLKAIAELGGGYPDAVALLSQAYAHRKLSCELFHDALPRQVEPSQLAKVAKDDPMLRTALPAVSH